MVKKIQSLTIIEVLVSSLLVMMSYLFLVVIYININKPDHGVDTIVNYYKIKSVRDSIMNAGFHPAEFEERETIATEVVPFTYDAKASQIIVQYLVSEKVMFEHRYIKY